MFSILQGFRRSGWALSHSYRVMTQISMIKNASGLVRNRSLNRIPLAFMSPSTAMPRRTMFVDAETTPNPQSMKFITGKEVLSEEFGTGMYFQRGARSGVSDTSSSPLAKRLFTVSGIKGVFLAKDFITVTKNNEESWAALKPQIFSHILDFYSEGLPVIEKISQEVSDTTILDTDDEVVATIKELIETRVRPAVQEDGGDIFYRGFDPVDGIVKVQLAGSCVGCPSSSVTLRNGVEKMLMHYVPEVKGIMDVGSSDGNEEGTGEVDDKPLVMRTTTNT